MVSISVSGKMFVTEAVRLENKKSGIGDSFSWYNPAFDFRFF